MTPPSPSVTVGWLVRARPEALTLGLECLAGERGFGLEIRSPYVLKTGLALAGFDAYLQSGRVLVFGASEIGYLGSLSATARATALARLLRHEIPCVLVTDGQPAPAELIAAGEQAGVPVLRTAVATPIAIAKLTGFLEDILAERTMLHAVLMDILGLGVLVVGESGIGKSECALDLVLRGHRLVADDTVEIRRRAESVLIGTCPEFTRYHMEIRGLGVINVKDLFGVASTRTSKRVELVVQLERWEPGCEYERLGLDDQFFEVLGLRIPLIRMPVAPGRSLANLVEVAARNQLLRSRGHHAARKLVARLDRQLRRADGAAPCPDTADDDGEQEET
ncbi:MAG: HPr(Ser) kinase/phosphatase [Acidobacteria bacterium]|nr:HPr(Ser) kinase/phosphatase [Acidobacteriota bacterium]